MQVLVESKVSIPKVLKLKFYNEKTLNRFSRMTKARMSIVGEGGDMAGLGINELDLETCLNEFPDETLIYLSDKYSIGIDDERREKEYNCFKVSNHPKCDKFSL